MRQILAALAVTAIGLVATPASAGSWTPDAWARESTVELRTTAPGTAEHWFPVWLVVLDGQLYVRLGSRAAGRIAQNQTGPWIGVRIAGQQFDHVRGESAPDQAGRVAAAMAAKYWTDVLVRHVNHPLTLRLVPE